MEYMEDISTHRFAMLAGKSKLAKKIRTVSLEGVE